MESRSWFGNGLRDTGVSVSKYKAVIFDLWGTLVDELAYPEANRLIFRQKTGRDG